jgi:hypothetical protein
VSSDDAPLNFVLRWKEGDAPRDTGGDSVAVEAASEQARLEAEQELTKGLLDSPVQLAEELSDEELADESFEWSADREQALIDAFEATLEGAVPRVHQQIEEIARALQEGTLDPQRAGLLLTEVEVYLAQKVTSEKQKPLVDHPAIMQARADKANALATWQEAVAALREYLSSGDAIQLKIAFYAAEQGVGFLAASRDGLLAAEPEWEIDENGEETDSPDQDFDDSEEVEYDDSAE